MTGRPDHRLVNPLGTFHAVTCRDAASLARDGEAYYAINNLPGAEGVQWEVMFGDGQWFLARLEDLDI